MNYCNEENPQNGPLDSVWSSLRANMAPILQIFFGQKFPFQNWKNRDVGIFLSFQYFTQFYTLITKHRIVYCFYRFHHQWTSKKLLSSCKCPTWFKHIYSITNGFKGWDWCVVIFIQLGFDLFWSFAFNILHILHHCAKLNWLRITQTISFDR